ISAVNASIAYNGSEQFTATGTYSDLSTAPLTGQVTWNSSNAAAATIGVNGIAAGVAAGQSNISATLSGIASNTFALTVTAGTAASITAVNGSGQSAIAGTAFASNLQAIVKDAG